MQKFELSEKDIQKNRTRFIEEINKIGREGIKGLNNYIGNETDFFSAPCSTKFHLSCQGGLCLHTLHVMEQMEDLVKKWMPGLAEKHAESARLIALTHDLCKADYFKPDFRNVKDEDASAKTGRPVWNKVPCYTIDDKLPLGHGEKSLFIVQRFLNISEEEALAIRWHMGGFTDGVTTSYGLGQALSKAYEGSPLIVLIHLADMQATHFIEKDMV